MRFNCLIIYIILGLAGTRFLHADLVFFIGVDNGNNSDVNHEANSDDHYYWEDGDYTLLGGLNWSNGQEPLHDAVPPAVPSGANDGGDPTIGFDRALTQSDNVDHIYFQLTLAELSTPRFLFTSDHVQANGTHDISYSMNGTPFHSVAAFNNGTVNSIFTPGDVGAVAGPNRITIQRTDLTTGGWVQYDYLSLQTIPEPASGMLVLLGGVVVALARRSR